MTPGQVEFYDNAKKLTPLGQIVYGDMVRPGESARGGIALGTAIVTGNLARVGAKAVNLPAWKKVMIDMEHIASGHMKGGSRVSSLKTLFPETWSRSQVERAFRDAYRVCQRVATQGDRVLLRGSAFGITIEMWINTATKTIETAYPVAP